MTTEHDFIKVAHINGRWHADRIIARPIIRQLRKEAGLTDAWPDPEDAYDRILEAAGRHGLGLEYTYTDDI